jgi:putative ABC transport system permease protein
MRLVRASLFGIGPGDPATFAGVVLLLGGGALLPCAVPAWRAARVDPAVALRYE